MFDSHVVVQYIFLLLISPRLQYLINDIDTYAVLLRERLNLIKRYLHMDQKQSARTMIKSKNNDT